MKAIWDALYLLIKNPYGVAGVMGNLQAESGLQPCCLEYTYRTRLGMTSAEYATAVDNGDYLNFVNDNAGWGLAQWTYSTHKQNLLDLARRRNVSIANTQLQIDYLIMDLASFSSVVNALRRSTSIREASDEVLVRYEKPADTSESMKQKRAAMSQKFFDQYGDENWMNAKEIGILESAKSRIGDPYVFGAWGEECTPSNRRSRYRADYPNIYEKCQRLWTKQTRLNSCDGCKYKGSHIYDCRGFTYRCLKDVGITINGAGATSQYNDKSNWIERGTTDKLPECICCLFKKKEEKMSHTGLYIGGGQIIHCSGEVKLDTIDTNWTHYAIPIGLYTEAELATKERKKVMNKLKKGSTGSEVKELQEALASFGYYTGVIDGIFGSGTQTAVKNFQAANNLNVDGVCGTMTWAVINQLKKSGSNPTPDPTPTPTPEPVDDKPITLTLEERVALLEQKVAVLENKK